MTLSPELELQACLNASADEYKGISIDLLSKMDVNHVYSDGWCALHHAVMTKHIDACMCLLSHGADVDKKGNDDCTALHLSVKHNLFDICMLLLDNNACIDDLDLISEGKYNPAIQEVLKNSYDFLTSCKASLMYTISSIDYTSAFVRDQFGKSGIDYAIEKHNFTLLRTLQDQGVNQKGIDIDALENTFIQKVNTYLKEEERDMEVLNSYLPIAAWNNMLDMVKTQVEHKADVNFADENGKTPLFPAASRNNVDIQQLQIAENADVNHVSAGERFEYGFHTALMVAAGANSLECCQIQLKHNADVNLVCYCDATAFHMAAKKGNLAVVELQLESKASINTQADYGATPLYSAARYGYPDTVKLLLENMADPNITSDSGFPPFSTALFYKHYDAAKVFLDYAEQNGQILEYSNKYGDHVLCNAAKHGHLDTVQKQLEWKTDANSCNRTGKSALFLAYHGEHMDIALQLLEHNANVDIAKYGQSLLFDPVIKNRLPWVKAFIQAKANLDVETSRSFETPLAIAVKANESDMMQVLLEGKANVQVIDKYRYTPLHTACRDGHLTAVKLLIEYKANPFPKVVRTKTPLNLAWENGHEDIIDELNKYM